MTSSAPVSEDPLTFGGTYRDRMRDAEAEQPTGPAGSGEPDGPGAPGDPGLTDTRAPDDDDSTVEKAKSFWSKLSARPGIAHLIRAGARFTDRLGNQFGAAITYFSFLAVVPLLLATFGITALVLDQNTIEQLKAKANAQVPGGLLSGAIDTAVKSAAAIGIIGLVIAIYSGIGWMANLRDAVQAQWRPRFEKTETEKQQKFYVTMGQDLLTLAGIGLALLVSIVLTAVGGSAQSLVLGWLGLDQIGWLRPVFSVVPFLLAIAADVIIFAWFYRMMRIPDYTPPKGAVLKGAVIVAVGFEVLKVAMTFLAPRLGNSPSAVVFGNIILLLFFFNLVAKLVLFVGAWIGTAEKPQSHEELPEIPGPAVTVGATATHQRSAGLLGAGAGAVAGFLAGRRGRRR